MKKSIYSALIFSFLCLSQFVASAQLIGMGKGQYQEIKSKTIHFVLEEYEPFDSLFQYSVKEYWTFGEYDFISQEEFLNQCANENEYFVLLDTYFNQMNAGRPQEDAMSFGFRDAYTVLTLVQGNKGRAKLVKKGEENVVSYKEWIVTVTNEDFGPYEGYDTYYKRSHKIDWSKDPVSYRIQLDVRTLQFLLEYSLEENKINFPASHLYYDEFPNFKKLDGIKMYVLEEDVKDFKSEIKQANQKYKFDIETISRTELVEIINSKEDAVIIDYSELGGKIAQFSFVSTSTGEMYYYNFMWVHDSWSNTFKQLDKRLK